MQSLLDHDAQRVRLHRQQLKEKDPSKYQQLLESNHLKSHNVLPEQDREVAGNPS
jgi:hypothetical protein